MDVSDEDSGSCGIAAYIEGGMGGEASQVDGRGGRGGLAPGADRLFGRFVRPHMKRPYWGEVEPGRGGDAPDTIQYQARRLIVEMIKAEHMAAPRYFTTSVWYERDAVPIDVINASLHARGVNWRVALEDHEYVMKNL